MHLFKLFILEDYNITLKELNNKKLGSDNDKNLWEDKYFVSHPADLELAQLQDYLFIASSIDISVRKLGQYTIISGNS